MKVTTLNVNISCQNSLIPQVTPEKNSVNLKTTGLSDGVESTITDNKIKGVIGNSFFNGTTPPSPTPSDDSSIMKKLSKEEQLFIDAEEADKRYQISIDDFCKELELQECEGLDLCDRSFDSEMDSDEGPEPGTKVTCYRPDGEVVSIVQPAIEYHYNTNVRRDYASVEKPSYHKCFRMEHYALFKDKNYNKNYHMIINGCLERYANLVMEIVSKVEKRESYTISYMDHKSYRLQRRFAERSVRKIQDGLSKFDMFPVKILNEKYLMEMVDGIDTIDRATLVKMIATTDSFEVTAVRTNSNTDGNVDIVTKFAGCEEKYTFGKYSL